MKRCSPPSSAHHVGTGPQHEVVGVAQHDLGADGLEVGGVERAHRPPGAHRHERRGAEAAPHRVHGAGPGRPVAGLQLVAEPPSSGPLGRSAGGVAVGHASARSSSMASPRDRKR